MKWMFDPFRTLLIMNLYRTKFLAFIYGMMKLHADSADNLKPCITPCVVAQHCCDLYARLESQ